MKTIEKSTKTKINIENNPDKTLEDMCKLQAQQIEELTAKLNWYKEQFRLSKEKQFGSSSEKSNSSETQAHAMELVKKAVFHHNIFNKPLVLHSDNGSPMKGQDFQNLLAHLGITKSYSRPRVSNDNAYSESLFKTLKYTKDFPAKGFHSIEAARTWVNKFVDLYNKEFMHSSIKFVTPHQRHYGLDKEILRKRKELYEKARQENPGRWSCGPRNWDYIDYVALNPVNKEELLEKTRQLT
jgi:hypothetical protein